MGPSSKDVVSAHVRCTARRLIVPATVIVPLQRESVVWRAVGIHTESYLGHVPSIFGLRSIAVVLIASVRMFGIDPEINVGGKQTAVAHSLEVLQFGPGACL